MNWIRPEWSVASGIHAAVTLRAGGVSCGKFDSLNLAVHVNDNLESVLLNRQRVIEGLALPSEPVWLQQVHGSKVIKVQQNTPLKQADASYADQLGVVCAVLTADCLPILVATDDGLQVAAIYAGWRGLLTGVIERTIDALQTTRLAVWLGPAIGVDCFEVGSEVRAAFIDKSVDYAAGFRLLSADKYLADIYTLARIALNSLGISHSRVYGGGFCTVTDVQRFYSYRRDGETGRMATLIWRE